MEITVWGVVWLHKTIYTRAMDFIDLRAQQLRIRERLDARIKAVLDHGKYILGPEIDELEKKLAEYCRSKALHQLF